MEEPRFKKLEATEEGGLRISMAPGELPQHFAEAMKSNLKDHDAPNYVETEFVDRETGERWTLLVQRAEGLTPGHKAHLEKTRADRLEARVAELEAAILKHKLNYIYSSPDFEDYELWKTIES